VLTVISCKKSADTTETSTSPSSWMTQNHATLDTMHIYLSTLLGSHDAASYGIHLYSKKCIGFISAHNDSTAHDSATSQDVAKYKCQSANLLAQLNYGVRFLDLTVAYQNSTYWSEHAFISDIYFGGSGIVNQIKQFLKTNPGEIVFLNFIYLFADKPMTKMTIVEQQVFYQILYDSLNNPVSLIYQNGNFVTTTFGDIWNSQKKVVILGNPACNPQPANPFIWDTAQLASQWFDTTNVSGLMNCLSRKLVDWKYKHEDPGRMRVLQAMTTTTNKIGDAVATNAALCQMMNNTWDTIPVFWMQVDDAVNSNLFPLMFKRLSRNP